VIDLEPLLEPLLELDPVGPPGTMVTIAAADSVGSALETAATVTCAVDGRFAGAE
jgi:hypothetical protein